MTGYGEGFFSELLDAPPDVTATDREDDRMGGRIDVEADDVFELLGELRDRAFFDGRIHGGKEAPFASLIGFDSETDGFDRSPLWDLMPGPNTHKNRPASRPLLATGYHVCGRRLASDPVPENQKWKQAPPRRGSVDTWLFDQII